jgi:NADPH-ferrihemoprotein reductase
VVEYQTKTGRTQKGVATNWLKFKKPDNGIKPRVPIYVRKYTGIMNLKYMFKMFRN